MSREGQFLMSPDSGRFPGPSHGPRLRLQWTTDSSFHGLRPVGRWWFWAAPDWSSIWISWI